MNFTCKQPISHLSIIGQGDDAIIYDFEGSAVKVFKGTSDDYHYQAFHSEVVQQLMISKLIKKGKLFANYYSEMIYYLDCCQSNNEQSFCAAIVYPKYKTDLEKFLLTSTQTQFNQIKNIISTTLTSYVILYQVTTMIHGHFVYSNILLDEKNNPIISDFGKMIKKPCIDHVKEFIWFIIQLRDYANGAKDKINRPWLAQLIQGPQLIKDCVSLINFFEIDQRITDASSKEIQDVFDYWIQ